MNPSCPSCFLIQGQLGQLELLEMNEEVFVSHTHGKPPQAISTRAAAIKSSKWPEESNCHTLDNSTDLQHSVLTVNTHQSLQNDDGGLLAI